MDILLALIICAAAHEGGHFLAALAFGHRIKFRLEWAYNVIPRGIWDMPEMESWKQKVVALAGFGLELAVGVIHSGWIVLAAALIHLTAYSFYAGEESDFKWLFR